MTDKPKSHECSPLEGMDLLEQYAGGYRIIDGIAHEQHTIMIPRELERDLRKGSIKISITGIRVKGWGVELERQHGQIGLYLCCEFSDGGNKEHCCVSFRLSDITKGTWKEIKFKDGTAKVQLVWAAAVKSVTQRDDEIA